MRISTRGEYGIRALIELSCRHGQGYTQSSEIAAVRRIPENYLYQLLITLRKAGLVRSRRGPQGGHMLARPPETISLEDAVLALEGAIESVNCIQLDVEDDCPFLGRCAVREVWQRIADETHSILIGTTFADLVRREGELAAEEAV